MICKEGLHVAEADASGPHTTNDSSSLTAICSMDILDELIWLPLGNSRKVVPVWTHDILTTPVPFLLSIASELRQHPALEPTLLYTGQNNLMYSISFLALSFSNEHRFPGAFYPWSGEKAKSHLTLWSIIFLYLTLWILHHSLSDCSLHLS